MVRNGVRGLLTECFGGRISVVAEANNGLEAIALVKRHRPDILILDAAMPHAKGIEVLAEARRWSDVTRVLLFTGFTSAATLQDWLSAGVDGIALKNCTDEEFVEAVTAIISGRAYLSRDVERICAEAPAVASLTLRERQVLSLLAQGMQTARVAERLGISPKTAEKHRASLMAKLKVSSLAELLANALKAGLLDQERQL